MLNKEKAERRGGGIKTYEEGRRVWRGDIREM